MALVRTDRLGQSNVSGGSAGAPISATSSSFTPSNNSLIVAAIIIINGPVGGVGGVADVRTGLVVSGGGLTWTKRLGPNGGTTANYTAAHEIWTAPVVTGASMTINIAHVDNNGIDPSQANFNVVDFTGYDAGSPIGGTASDISTDDGAKTITLSSSPASTSIVFASRNFQSNGNDANATQGAGWTEIYDLTNFGYGALQSQIRGSSTSTSVAWADLADQAETAWLTSCFAIEIKEAAAVDWFSELSIPRPLFKRRPSDFPAFTMPSQIIVPPIWLQEFVRPLPRQQRPEGGYINPSYVAPAATVAIDWFSEFSRPLFRKRLLLEGGYVDPTFIPSLSIFGWFQPFIDPTRRKTLSDLSFNDRALRIAAVLDWFEPLSEPKRFARQWQYTSDSFFAPSRVIANDIVTVDKWFMSLSMPVRYRVLATAHQQALAMVKAAPFGENVSIDRWLQSWSVPAKLSKDGIMAAAQLYATIDPVTPPTPPPTTGDFTVSGRSVEDLFLTTGVNYTYAPITHRTN